MRKTLFLLTSILLLFLFSGCYNYGKGSQYGALEEVAFFDLEHNEIEGKLFNSREIFQRTPQVKLLSAEVLPLNAPAPIELFYCSDFSDGADVIVQLKIKLGVGCSFHGIYIDGQLFGENDVYHSEVSGRYAYVELLFQGISKNKSRYIFGSLYLKKELEDETRIVEGSIYIGPPGRTYLSGFYFNFEEESVFDWE